MLTLTEEAVDVVRELTTQPGMPERAGLRIAAAASNDGESNYAILVAAAPLPSDQVMETGGARLFLDPTAAVEFDGKALDATVEDGQVRFEVTDPTESTGAGG